MPPTHPVPPPQPNPALDCYIKSGRTPPHKAQYRRSWWVRVLLGRR